MTTHLLAPLTLVCLMASPAVAAPPLAATTFRTPHFRVHAVEGTERSAARVASEAEARRERLCAAIAACELATEPIDVWLAPDAEGFAAAFPGTSPMTEWAVGVAFLHERRIVLRAFGSSLFSLLETFEHEVSHLLVHDAVGGRRVPRWFSEGIAIWHAGEPVLERLLPAQRAAMTDRLVPLAELDRGFPARGAAVSLAYAEGALFVSWLEREHGLEALPRLLALVREGGSFGEAFAAAFGAPVEELEARWRAGLEERSTLGALLGDPNLMWGLMSLLFIGVALVRMRQRRAELAAMAREEGLSDGPSAGPPTVLH